MESKELIIRKPNNYWNYNTCKNAAKNCDSRTNFRIKFVSAYNCSIKNKWIDDICSHMKLQGNLRKRLVYAYEFSDNHAYIGITCSEIRRNNQHMNLFGCVYNHKIKTGLIPIKKILSNGYVNIDIAVELESEYVKKYKLNGWNILNTKKTGGLGSNIVIWNKEKCKEKANKCTSRKEFSILFSSAYISARKNFWLNEICEHMIQLRKPHNYWNYETCKNESIKYNTRFDFSHKSSGAYFVSTKNNWLDDFYPKKYL